MSAAVCACSNAVALRRHRLRSYRAARTAPADQVEAGVGGDPVQPRLEVHIVRRRRRLAERLEEHVLGHVLRLLAIAEDAGAQVVHGRVVVAVDARE